MSASPASSALPLRSLVFPLCQASPRPLAAAVVPSSACIPRCVLSAIPHRSLEFVATREGNAARGRLPAKSAGHVLKPDANSLRNGFAPLMRTRVH